MKHQSKILLFIAITILTSSASAQIVTEELFPVLPLKKHGEKIVPGKDMTLFIVGTMGDEYELFDDTYGYSIPYYFKKTGSHHGHIITIPDTNHYYNRPFDSKHEVLKTDFAVTEFNTPTVAWSKMVHYWQDYSPHLSFYWKFATHLASEKDGKLSVQRVYENAINPSIATPSDIHGPRIVYEVVTPLDTIKRIDPDSSRFQFTKYASSIYYDAPFSLLMNSLGPLKIGKGFLPNMKVGHDQGIHVVWFDADSSTAKTATLKYRKATGIHSFDSAVSLVTYPFLFSGVIPPYYTFQWSVDTEGTVHVSYGPRYVLHYNKTSGVRIDSLESSFQYKVDVRFMPDGETRVLWSEEWGPLSSFHLNYSATKNFPLFTKWKYLGEISLKPNTAQVIDTAGRGHLFINGDPAYLRKDFATERDTAIQLYKGYKTYTDPIVDANNTAWSIGQRDSTQVFLKYSLHEIDRTDFTFPLNVGDEWQFLEIKGLSIADWELFRLKVLKDSVALNGKSYRYLSNGELLRKDGLKIYSFVPFDSVEYVQYDFTKKAGDTVTVMKEHAGWRTVVLEKIESTLFGRTYWFKGNVNLFGVYRMWKSAVTDSVGFTGWECGLCEIYFSFQGALVGGRQYGTIVSVKPMQGPVPHVFDLAQNYPNPFNPSTRIEFSLPQQSLVTLKIFDVVGREVMTVMNEERPAGRYRLEWNGRDYEGRSVSSGIYFYQMTAGGFMQSRKMVLLK